MSPTTISADGRPTLDAAVASLRGAVELHAALPPAAGSLPAGSLSFDAVRERTVGLGHLRGRESFGPLGSVAAKGGRLEARLRFELWGAGPAAVRGAVEGLQGRLRQAGEDLRAAGLLRLSLVSTEAAEPVSSGFLSTSWRQATVYEALYEYRYVDSSGATGLITRISVEGELDSGPGSAASYRVTGPAVRWDNESTPSLRLRGPARLARLGALVYFPGSPPSGGVTLLRSWSGAAGPGAPKPDLPAFLAAAEAGALGDPAGRHLRLEFPRLAPAAGPPPEEAFLHAFSSSGDEVVLGNWEAALEPPAPDLDLDIYEMQLLDLTPALVLPSRADSLEIFYQPAPFDEIAALYLRAEGSP